MVRQSGVDRRDIRRSGDGRPLRSGRVSTEERGTGRRRRTPVRIRRERAMATVPVRRVSPCTTNACRSSFHVDPRVTRSLQEGRICSASKALTRKRAWSDMPHYRSRASASCALDGRTTIRRMARVIRDLSPDVNYYQRDPRTFPSSRVVTDRPDKFPIAPLGGGIRIIRPANWLSLLCCDCRYLGRKRELLPLTEFRPVNRLYDVPTKHPTRRAYIITLLAR